MRNQSFYHLARIVNRAALCILGVCLPIVPVAILGTLCGILTIDQGADVFAFYVGNAAVFAPLILGAFIAWGCTSRTAELA